MTPDKRVEEIVEQMFDTEYIGGKQPNLNKEWLRTTLTQYRQDLMSDVVERLEGMRTTLGETPDTDKTKGILPITDPQMKKGYCQALTKAQTIIKSLTPLIQSDVR